MNDLAKLNEKASGEVFLKDGEVWLCVGYTDQPTVSMRRLDKSEHGSYIPSAPNAEPFKHQEMNSAMNDWFWGCFGKEDKRPDYELAAKLLADPHPGLFTWQEALADALSAQ